MLELVWICDKIKKNEYYFSKHADNERQNDNLAIAEVEEAVLNGGILESYSDTGRGTSCLIGGFTDNGQPIHIVCGERKDWLVIITVYRPSPPKFKNPFERGEK